MRGPSAKALLATAAAVGLTVIGCGAPSPAPTAKTSPAGKTAPARPSKAAPNEAPTPAPAAKDAAAAIPTPLSAEQMTQVQALANRFARACDTDALAQLRGVRQSHGSVPPPLANALLAAFKACGETVAAAQLLAETLPPDAGTDQRLQLGAAWLRASRYEEAAEILVPLAQQLGPQTQAAWLAGFSLFHAGRSEEALPWLQGARAHGKNAGHADRPLLIGLARLHTGDTEGAIAELESGVQAHPQNPGLSAALTRAYTKAGRTDDAARAAKQTEAAYAAAQQAETEKLRLSAKATELSAARAAGHNEDVLRIIDEMWPTAPDKLRAQLLTVRISVYEQTGDTTKLAEAKQALAALSPGGQP